MVIFVIALVVVLGGTWAIKNQERVFSWFVSKEVQKAREYYERIHPGMSVEDVQSMLVDFETAFNATSADYQTSSNEHGVKSARCQMHFSLNESDKPTECHITLHFERPNEFERLRLVRKSKRGF
jgi:hypothetical protein